MTDIDMGPDPTKLMLLGDTHHDVNFVSQAIEHAEKHGADTIVQVGDLGFWPNRYPQYLDDIDAALSGTGIRFFWLDGNHDHHGLLDPGMRHGAVQHLPRGHRWTWWDKTFMAIGGGATLNRRAYTPGWDWFSQETLTTEQANYCARPGEVDIIVSHDCPDGVESLQRKLRPHAFPADEIAESERHRALLGEIIDALPEQPRLLVHGHYHRFHDGRRNDMRVIGLAGNEEAVELATVFLDKGSLP